MKPQLVTILVFVAVCLSSSRAFGCSCAGAFMLSLSYRDAEAVFVGTVLSIQRPPDDQDIVRFRVIQGFKGVREGEEVEIKAGYGLRSYSSKDPVTGAITVGVSGSTCSVPFREGERYLVDARGSRENLFTSMCTRTRHVDHAAGDLLYLSGEGEDSRLPCIFGHVAGREGENEGIGVEIEDESGMRLQTSTDELGSFMFLNVKPGKYEVRLLIKSNRGETLRQVLWIGNRFDGYLVHFFPFEHTGTRLW